MTDTPPEGFRQWRYTPPPGATTILLVRHGESAAAHPDAPFPLMEGHGDPPLHEEGRHQAERVGARLAAEHAAGLTVSAIYVTTLQRTHQTAAPLATALGLEPRVERDLREVHLGEWEGGMFRQKAAEADPVLLRVYETERWDEIPGAEPLDTFEARLAAAITRIASTHPDERVVAVTHGGVIGHLLHRATGSSRFTFSGADNASISELVVMPDRWVLRRYNDTSHLTGP
ncbi:MAG TPA: histidine phosphatase family protein [Microthrixaceae bacterium]|nr:histidine phosphatase family protein [Microthrixaceae bacterium]